MLPLQQLSRRRPHNTASAQHHHVLPSDGHASSLDEFNAAGWRAWNEAREVTAGYATLIYGVKAEIEHDYVITGTNILTQAEALSC